jgi:hypothetical protein
MLVAPDADQLDSSCDRSRSGRLILSGAERNGRPDGIDNRRERQG